MYKVHSRQDRDSSPCPLRSRENGSYTRLNLLRSLAKDRFIWKQTKSASQHGSLYMEYQIGGKTVPVLGP